MATHTSKTFPQNIKLYEDRLKYVDLIWCKQVVYMLKEFCLLGQISVNDIGCNYGQLYKEIKRRGLEKKIDYNGYDIDELFLNMAKKAFPECASKFVKLDAETERLDIRDITICSATFEHFDNPQNSLKKMLAATSKHIILRTFVGSESINFVQDNKSIVAEPYNINQFNLFELCEIFFEQGFTFNCLKDEATESIPKEITSGLYRTMYIIVGTRISD